MKKIQIKRVFLVDEANNCLIIPQDFLATLSNDVILGALYQPPRDIWIGNSLYHTIHQNGMIRHWRYEVVLVTEHEKSWYNHLIDAVRRI